MTQPDFSAYAKLCDSCKKPIIMALSTSTGSVMPMNAEPEAHGEWVIEAAADGSPRTRHLSAQFRFGVKALHVSHFSDCPNAPAHRRPRKRSRS